ncbi:hypothetical protein SUGI_0270340 [Cryptomeria japonica]|nr:hypothetical protein SUGI_0270340 [Cryptomeria japonica]
MMVFWGPISDKRLTNILLFEEHTFLAQVKIVLGDEYLRVEFKCRTNIEVTSMFASWCLELESKEQAEWLLRGCVREEWCGGLDSFLRMIRDGVGFVCPNGAWFYASDFKPSLHPYFFWSANCNKEARRTTTQIGLHGMK